MQNINLFPLGKRSRFSFIPELDVPMPQQNSDLVGLISSVPPQLVYIHQLKIMPNPMKVIKYNDIIQGRQELLSNCLTLFQTQGSPRFDSPNM